MCCCSLKKDVKPDLKEDAWQLILKGKILPTTFSDWVEVLITIYSCLHYSLYLQKFKWKKDQHAHHVHFKKIMYMQTNLYGYYYYTCDLTACVDLYTKSDSW